MADFDCQSFVEVAGAILEDVLTGGSASQGHFRTIVGRAYYGAYGYLRQRIVKACGNCFGTAGKHTQLISACLGPAANPHVVRIGSRLQQLQALRVRADYECDSSLNITSNEAETAVDIANKLCDKIGKLQANDLQFIYSQMI